MFKQLTPKIIKRVRWDQWRGICKSQLLDITKPFYEKWKHSGLVEWGPYIKEYSSLTLKFKAGYLVIPYRFLLYESYYPANNSLEMLNQNPSETTYERAVSHLCMDLNIKFRKPESMGFRLGIRH